MDNLTSSFQRALTSGEPFRKLKQGVLDNANAQQNIANQTAEAGNPLLATFQSLMADADKNLIAPIIPQNSLELAALFLNRNQLKDMVVQHNVPLKELLMRETDKPIVQKYTEKPFIEEVTSEEARRMQEPLNRAIYEQDNSAKANMINNSIIHKMNRLANYLSGLLKEAKQSKPSVSKILPNVEQASKSAVEEAKGIRFENELERSQTGPLKKELHESALLRQKVKDRIVELKKYIDVIQDPTKKQILQSQLTALENAEPHVASDYKNVKALLDYHEHGINPPE